MKKLKVLLVAISISLPIVHCSDRENPVDVSQPSGLYFGLFFQSQSIDGDVMQDFPGRNIIVYTPPGYPEAESIVPGDTTIYEDPPDTVITPPDTTFVDYPVLYLLHGYGGDHNYFKGLFGLAGTIDDLINSGQIDPMLVVTPNATNNLGGSFYTNSPDFGSGSYAGLMEDFITEEVVHVIDSVFHTIADRDHRGIAGHSMGGYGAVKLAMLRNDLFASASSMSGPLAFMGKYPDESNPLALGLLTLMPAMFAENGFVPPDTAAFYSITPGAYMDSEGVPKPKTLTNMMFAMAAAFSPHDPADDDTSFAHSFTTTGFTGYVDLPFDANGQLAESVWNLWMANDVTSLFAAGLGGVFDSTALYVDCGAQDDLLLQYQAEAFGDAAGITPDIYPGFGSSYPADHATYIGSRLPEVIKFHDQAFNQ